MFDFDRWVGRARLEYAANRLVRRTRPKLTEVAVRSEEIAPAEHVNRPASPMLPGMLERARACDPVSTLEKNIAIAKGGPAVHGASVAYTLRDAVIEPASIYAGGAREALADVSMLEELRWSARHRLEVIERAMMVSTWHGMRYFADWLYDNNTRVLPAERLGAPPIEVEKQKPFLHAPRYIELLDLPRRQVRRARVKELIVLDDVGQNRDKTSRYHILRERARRVPGDRKDHGVFVVRGRWGKLRYLANEEECIAWARGHGFTIIDPMRMNVDETLTALRDAKYVVGVDGSALLHALMVMSSEGAIEPGPGHLAETRRRAPGHHRSADRFSLHTSSEISTRASAKVTAPCPTVVGGEAHSPAEPGAPGRSGGQFSSAPSSAARRTLGSFRSGHASLVPGMLPP